MLEPRNLFRVLEDEWLREGRSSDARDALVRWSEETPELARFGDPLTLVRRCHERDDHAPRLLAVVLRAVARDRWAERTVLQAVLPGLRTVARRASRHVGGPRPVWQSRDELDQDVVETALERIRALAGADPAFPCRTIVDGTWQRLRHRSHTLRRESDRRVELKCVDEAVDASVRSGLEDLALLVIAAVERGVLDQFDGGLVYSCHVKGYRIEELARITGRSERTLWRRRRNAEKVLAMARRLDSTSKNARLGSQALPGGQGPILLLGGEAREAGVKGALRRPSAALDSGPSRVRSFVDNRQVQGIATECGSDGPVLHPY